VKSLLAAILLLEAVVVGLAIPVAVLAAGRSASTAWLLAGLAVLLVLAAGTARRPHGVTIGWAMQVLILLAGLLVPALLVLGLVFLGVWVVAIVYGAKGDRLAAENAARARSARGGVTSVTPAPSGDSSGAPSTDG
jgi:hypothetical protein